MGSSIQTLRERTGLTDNEIRGAVATLNEIKATDLRTLSVMMTGHGSEALQGSITSLGKKMLVYVDHHQQASG
jgi:hypothetical protein